MLIEINLYFLMILKTHSSFLFDEKVQAQEIKQ
jgi:hypothetical protein